MVERELSKTHSIEGINIESARNGEKILTIHYDRLPESKNQGSQVEKQEKNSVSSSK